MAVDMFSVLGRAGILPVLSMLFLFSGCRREMPVADVKAAAAKSAVREVVEVDRTCDTNYLQKIRNRTREEVQLSRDYAKTLQLLTQCEARIRSTFTHGREDLAVDSALFQKALKADAEWQRLTALAAKQKAEQAHQLVETRAMIGERLRREQAARKHLQVKDQPALSSLPAKGEAAAK